MKIDELLRALPSREDIIHAVGLQSQPSKSEDIVMTLGIFGTGILLGAGLALLFAPKAGAEIRRDLAKRVGEFSDRLGANGPDGRSDESAASM